MNKYVLYTIGLIAAVVAQILLFDNLPVWGGVAFVYLIPLIKISPRSNRILQIFLGFLVGILVDVCCNTHGMHALAACTTMFFRAPLYKLILGEEAKEKNVNIADLGLPPYSRYSLTMIAVHSLLLYMIEAFTFFNLAQILTKVMISILLTWAFAIVWELATQKR